jgi:hypothetical protein
MQRQGFSFARIPAKGAGYSIVLVKGSYTVKPLWAACINLRLTAQKQGGFLKCMIRPLELISLMSRFKKAF